MVRKTRLPLIIMIVAMLALTVNVVSAGRLWCKEDPPVALYGDVWNVELQVQVSQVDKIDGAPVITLRVHPDAHATPVPFEQVDPVFNGYHAELVIVEDVGLSPSEAILTVAIPAHGNVNARFVVTDPDGNVYDAHAPAKHLRLALDVGP